MGGTQRSCFNFKFKPSSHSREDVVDVVPPQDVRDLFSQYAGEARDMGEEDLRRYLLKASQAGAAGHDDVANVVNRLLEQILRQGPSSRRFTLDDFHRILFSHDLNPPIRHQHVHQDMTLPLSQYFIYTAHNTDHTRPNQLRRGSGGRRSDDDPIVRALKMGVRAIEVSMWPNSKQDDIKVHYGWTRNTPVLLTECLKSIKEYAFVASRYPVIITLEDNLQSSNLQKKAAKVLLDVLGDVLYWPHADYIDVRGNAFSNNKPLKNLPSPSPVELMGVVLLSTKPPNLIKMAKVDAVPWVDVPKVHGTIEQDDDDAAWGPEVPVFQTQKIQSNHEKNDGGVQVQPRLPTLQESGALPSVWIFGESYPSTLSKGPTLPKAKYKGVLWRARLDNDAYDDEYPLYRHLITIRPHKSMELLDVDELQSEPGEVIRRFSCSEQQIEKAAEYRGTDIVRFTQRNLLHIYPSVSIKSNPGATSLTSTNYNPFLGWVHGAQMVALKMQDYGRALWLMHGFYRANGGCGYVRKPDFLMQTKPNVFDPSQPVKKTLKVKVYMGDGWLMDFKHAHTSFIPDLWTSVGIAGVPADTTTMMKSTNATEATWYPAWGDEFSFPLTVPEIALLRVEVHRFNKSERDIFGGQTVLPVWELRPGIRAVALFDRQGNRLNNVRLLMRFEFEFV